MATAMSRAQDVITCDLCEEAAQKFCNNCQTNLCLDCVGKHVNETKSSCHPIVSFQYRNIRLLYPECEIHPNQRCEIQCQQCHIPICGMCCIGQHKGHDAEELAKIVDLKKQTIEKEIEDAEVNILPKYQTADANLEDKVKQVRAEFAKMREEKVRLRNVWHQEVDDIFDKAEEVIASMENVQISSLTAMQTKIKSKIPQMRQTVKHQTEILRSNDAAKINNFQSVKNENQDIIQDIMVQFPSLIENTDKGRDLKLEIGSLRATMTQTFISSQAGLSTTEPKKEFLDKSKVVIKIYTDYTPLWRVVCVEAGWAWISGRDKTIARIDTNGSIQDTVTTTDDWPNDIAMTLQRELIFSENTSKAVKIVRHGNIETLMTTPHGWEPWGLCCTSFGDILVHVCNGGRNKLLRYEGEKITHEIDRDEQGKPIFTNGEYVLSMAENNNGDVCVSDRNAGAVVVIDRKGRVRFRYDGTSVGRKGLLNLQCIVTDAWGHIIVADVNNACLHILDQNGNFLRYVDNRKLIKPVGLSIDTKGRLWVALSGTGEIKVIEYIK
ncbi:uncharacterized protein LOC111102691 [Crassostrea virginica]